MLGDDSEWASVANAQAVYGADTESAGPGSDGADSDDEPVQGSGSVAAGQSDYQAPYGVVGASYSAGDDDGAGTDVSDAGEADVSYDVSDVAEYGAERVVYQTQTSVSEWGDKGGEQGASKSTASSAGCTSDCAYSAEYTANSRGTEASENSGEQSGGSDGKAGVGDAAAEAE